MKKAVFLILIFVQACEAKQDTFDQALEKECGIAFGKLDECSFKTPSYDISVAIITEDVAEDEKLISAVVIKNNSTKQTLPVTEATSMLDGDVGYISFSDINFDSVPDLAIPTSFGTPNLYLDYWVYDVQKQAYEYLGNFPQFSIDKKRKIITTRVKESAAEYQIAEWHWNKGKLERKE
ncbi:XAC2610-related protein [Cellvibrio sp. ARAG 10.3]|uniref:XAC2610-related protein n=1 Tax=Cellvibrio sp. ARAG 10.3 TaxID=3451358 RepID=UPI003F47A2B3